MAARALQWAAVFTSVCYLVLVIPMHRPCAGHCAFRPYSVPWPAQLVVKACPALFWAAAVRRGGGLPRRHRVAAALVFCAVGDAFLACPVLGAGGFTLGLAAFLVAHLCWISAFVFERDAELSRTSVAKRLVPYATTFVVMYAILFPKLQGVMIFAVALYAFALTSMAATTALRGGVPRDSYLSGLVGSTFFMCTDGLLSIFHFHAFGPTPYLLPQWAVMVTYYAAIAGLARAKIAAEPGPAEAYRHLPASV